MPQHVCGMGAQARRVLANVLQRGPKGLPLVVGHLATRHAPERLDAAMRTIFAQPDRTAAGQQLPLVAQTMAPRWPRAAELLREAEGDVLAYMASPPAHWTRLYSTNPLERLNVGSVAAARSSGAPT